MGQFIIAAANLRAKMMNIPWPANHRDPEYIRSVVDGVVVADFVPTAQLMETGDKEEDEKRRAAAAAAEDPDAKLKAAVEAASSGLAKLPPGFSVFADEFEKDHDDNFHMDFIHAFGNLRARNYEISEVDRLQAKGKAGRIIPAIATTTAMITGFVCLELYKVVADLKMESFRNAFANLALPLFSMAEPFEAAKSKSRTETKCPDPQNHPEYTEEMDIKCVPEGFTVWDRIVVEGGASMTLQNLMDYFEKEHGIAVSGVGFALKGDKKGGDAESKQMYHEYMPGTHGNKEKGVIEFMTQECGHNVKGRAFVAVEGISFVTKDTGDDVETPTIVFKM